MRIRYKNNALAPPSTDPGNQRTVGRVNSKTIKLSLFQLEQQALWAGDRFLKREAYPTADVTIKGKRTLFKHEPGDNFKFSYETYGLLGRVFRNVKIEEEAPDNEDIIISAIEDVEYLGNAMPIAGPSVSGVPEGFYVLYSAYDSGAGTDILRLGYSIDGLSWSHINLDYLTEPVGYGYSPGIVSDGVNLYGCFIRITMDQDDLYFIKSVDGTIFTETRLTNVAYQYGCSIASPAEGVIFIITVDWSGDGYLVLHRSVDSGETWDSVNIFTNTIWDSNIRLHAVSADVLCAIFNDDNSPQNVRIYRSVNGGDTWSNVFTSPCSPVSYAEHNSIHGVGNNLFAAWVDFSANNQIDIYFSKSTDGGATWSDRVLVKRITENGNWLIYLDIEVYDASHACIIYNFAPGVDWLTGVSYTTNGGSSWDHVTTMNSLAVHHRLTHVGSIFYCAYNDGDWGDQTTGQMFAASDDGGATWDSVQIDSEVLLDELELCYHEPL